MYSIFKKNLKIHRMKTTYLLLLLFFAATINIIAQKPKKTYDYKVFAEKFTKNTRGTIEPLFGYAKEWSYIAGKIGKSVDDVSKLSKKHYTRVKEEVQKTKAKGLLMIYDKAELSVVQESPIKVANIKIFVSSGNDKYTFTLKNCVQTDKTWVLGDDAIAEGQMFDSEEAVSESVTTGNTNKNVPYKGYLKFNKETVGKEMKGYYVTTEGTKVEAVILNDNPNNMHNNDIELSLFKKAFGEQGYTKNSSNFNKSISKNSLRAFFVAKHLYIKTGSDWYILIDEAPIGKVVRISSSTVYKTPESVEKLDLIGKPVRGYYIDKNGKRINAVIKYQNVETLKNMNSTFLLYNIAYNEKGFTEDESNNFRSILMKKDVKEFHLADFTYYKVNVSALNPGGEWRVQSGDISYTTGKYIYKVGDSPKEESMLVMGFKNSMSKLTADYAELSSKIKNKEKGYKFTNVENIIKEYNEWYLKQYPGKFKYVLADTKTVALEEQELTEETGSNSNTNAGSSASPEQEKFGKALLEAFKSDTPDKLLTLSWTSTELINTFKEKTGDEKIKNKFISWTKRKDPNNDGMQKETKEQFRQLKQKELSWERAEYVDFKFSKEGISKDVNFNWGSAILQFESEEAHYELKIGEFIHLLNGWKGAGYMFK